MTKAPRGRGFRHEPCVPRHQIGLRTGALANALTMGGGGDRFLDLVAEYADEWNFIGELDWVAQRGTVLDEKCRAIGRDPAEIARSVLMPPPAAVENADAYAEIGITHLTSLSPRRSSTSGRSRSCSPGATRVSA
jgi:alkanesulfonate monooxygenase SsuD/methylene tetrahydromethanopterin reductase-like flavin-dependent oxidoreductase (luciferase family)